MLHFASDDDVGTTITIRPTTLKKWPRRSGGIEEKGPFITKRQSKARKKHDALHSERHQREVVRQRRVEP